MAIKTPNVPDVIVSQLIQCFRVSTKGSIEGSILDSQCTIMCSKIKQQVFCSFVVSCFANSIYCDDDMRLEEKVKIADQTKLSQKEHREYLITKEFWPGSDGGGSGRAQGGGAVGLGGGRAQGGGGLSGGELFVGKEMVDSIVRQRNFSFCIAHRLLQLGISDIFSACWFLGLSSAVSQHNLN